MKKFVKIIFNNKITVYALTIIIAVAVILTQIYPISAENTISGISIPVLMYHSVDETEGIYPQLTVKTSEFAAQMCYLYENGYTPVHFGKPDNYNGIAKPIIITFDDGYENNYINAYPVLNKYHFPATIFLVGSTIGTPGHLTLEQLKEMSGLIQFGSHTVSHSNLAKLDFGKIKCELIISKIALQKLTGQLIDVLAYPYGSYDNRVIEIARKWYDYAVTVKNGFYNTNDDNMLINRIYITRSDTVEQFAAKLSGSAS
jgi:Predicted xylanase/chitin deacetylase